MGEVRGTGDKGLWFRIVGMGSSNPRVGEGRKCNRTSKRGGEAHF